MNSSRKLLARSIAGLAIVLGAALAPSAASAGTPPPSPHDDTTPYTWDPGNP